MTAKKVFSLSMAMFFFVAQCSINGLDNLYAADPVGGGQNTQQGVNPFGGNNNNQNQGIPPGNNLNGNPLNPASGYDIKGYSQKDISWIPASGVSVNNSGLLTLNNASALSSAQDETNRITYGQTAITGKFKPDFEGIISLKDHRDPGNLYLQTKLVVQNGDRGTKWITFYAPRFDNGNPYEGIKRQLSADEFNNLEFTMVRGVDSIEVYFRKSGENSFSLAYRTNHNNRVDSIYNSVNDITAGKGLQIEVKGTGSLNIRMSDKGPITKGTFYVSNNAALDAAGNSLGDGTEANPFSIYDVLEGRLGVPANRQIIVKPGTYILSRPIEVYISNVKIIGEGATIIPGGDMIGKATAESECMHLRGENLDISGFKFTNAPNYDPAQNRFQPESSGGGNSDGYFKGNSGYAIRVFGKNVTIRGCDFSNITGGIAGHADGLLTIADNSFAYLGYKSWVRNYGDGMSIYISLANPAARVITTGNVFGPALGGLKFFSYVNAVANIVFENNVLWNPTDGPFKRSESGGLFFATVHDNNPALNSMRDLAVNNNGFYNNGLAFGWEPNVVHRNVEAVNNYIAGGALSFTNWQDMLVTNNTIISNFLSGSEKTLLSLYLPTGSKLDHESEINYNHYYSLATAGSTYEMGDDFTVRGKDLRANTYRFDETRNLVGNDEASSYTHGLPLSEKQMVIPSRYDARSAIAAVYNWARKDSTELNVSDFAKNGDRIELKDFQNNEVVVGTYTVVDGKITVPLNLTATSRLYGFTDSTNPHTSKEFNVFSLKITGNATFTQVNSNNPVFATRERRVIELGNPGEVITVKSPLYGTLTRIENNRYSYEASPDTQFSHPEDSFSYTRANGEVVNIRIQISKGDLPSRLATPDTVTTPIRTPASIDLSNYVSDADTDLGTLKFRIVRQPAQGTAALNGSLLTFTPSNSYVRESMVQIEVYNPLTGVKSEPVEVRFYVRDFDSSDFGAAVYAPLQTVAGQQVNLSWNILSGQKSGDVVLVRNMGSGEVFNYQLTDGRSNGQLPTTFTSAGTYSFSYLTDGLTDRVALATATITVGSSVSVNLPIARNQQVQLGEDNPFTFQPLVSEASGALVNNPNLVLSQAPKYGAVEFINGSIKYTPNANYFGNDSFSYKFKNSAGVFSNEAVVSLTINPKNDVPVVGQIVDGVNAYQLSAQDIDSNFVWQWSGMRQDGTVMILGSGYGDSILNLRKDSYLTSLNLKKVMARVYEGGVAVTREWIVPTTPSVQAPVVLPVTVNTDEDTAASVQLSAKYPDGSHVPNPVFSVVASPQNGVLQIDNLGRATFTPAANFNGSRNATYRVFDGQTYSEPAVISFHVNAVNDAPSIVVDGLTTVEEGKAVSLVAVGQDVDGDTLTYSVTELPQGASFDANLGLLTWTPNNNQSGTYPLVFRVSDGKVSVDKAITLVITDTQQQQNPPNNSSTIVIDALTGNVTGNLFRTLADGLLSLKNNLDPAQIDNGKVTFTVNLSESQAGKYYLWARTQSPSPKSDSLFAAVNGQSLVIFDTVTDGKWNTDPRWARLSQRNANGDPDVNRPIELSLNAGVNTIVIGVREVGVLLSKLLLTQDLTFDPKNGIPGLDLKAMSETFSGNEDTVITGTVSAQNAGTNATFTIVSNSENGNVIMQPDGKFTYTPSANFNGNDKFTFKVTSGNQTATATITLNVDPVNDAPQISAISGDATIGENVSKNYSVTATDVDSNSLTVKWFLRNGNTETLLGTGLALNQSFNPGSYTLVAKASDGFLEAMSVLTLTVTTNAPQLSEIKANKANPEIGDTIIFTASSDKPVSWGWSVVDPSGTEVIALSGSGAIGDFNYKPLKKGSYIIKISAADGINPVVVKSLSILVSLGKPIASDISKEIQGNSISIPITATYKDGTAVANPTVIIVSTSSNAQAVVNGSQITVNSTSSDPITIQYKVNDNVNDSNVATISLTMKQSQISVQDGTSFKAANSSEIQVSGTIVRATERRDPSRYYVTATRNNLTGQAPGSAAITFHSDKADVYYALLEVYAPTASNDSFEVFLNGQRLGIYDMLQNRWSTSWQTEFLITRENGMLPLALNVQKGSNTLEFVAREAYSALSKVTLVKNIPIAKPLEITTNEDNQISSQVKGENAERYVLNTTTQNGELVFNADGNFKYTPRENFNGVDSFTYYATRGAIASAAVKVTIQVLSVNDAPAVQIQVPAVAESNQLISLVANGSDVDGDSLTYQWSIFNAAGGKIAAGSGAQWNYNFVTIGDYQVEVTVSDSKVSTKATAAIKINPPDVEVRNFSTTLQRPNGTLSTDYTVETGGTIKGNATVVINNPAIKLKDVLWSWNLTDINTQKTIVLKEGRGAVQNLKYVVPENFTLGSYRLHLKITVGSTISLNFYSYTFEVKKRRS